MVYSMVEWKPRTSLFHRFPRELDDLMGRFSPWDEGSDAFFAPAADIAETEEGYEVSLDLPGMKPEEVQIEWKDGRLWISGQRTEAQEAEGKTYHRLERRYGQFRRVLALGTDVDAEKIEAEFHDGVLRICIPRTAESRARKIEVKA